MACGSCKNSQENIPDFTKSVNLFKFNANREQVKDPSLPDSLSAPPPPLSPTAVIEGPTPTPQAKKDLPSIKKIAFSLTEAIKDNIKQAVSGGAVLASPDVLLKRLDLCSACEFLIAEQSRCSKCGCFMNVKTRLQASKCPVGKW